MRRVLPLSACVLISLSAVLSFHIAEGGEITPACRYGNGEELPPHEFKPKACCGCYMLIFRVPNGKSVGSGECNQTTYRIENPNSNPPISVDALPSNSEAICEMAESKTKCDQWLDCCQEAIDCCDEQITDQEKEAAEIRNSMPSLSISVGQAEPTESECPATWDMLRCWKKAKPSTFPRSDCPTLFTDNVKDCVDAEIHYAERECLGSGFWNATLSTGLRESSYIKCTQPLNCHQVWIDAKHIIEISCEVLSLCAVLPAILIFVSYRSLYTQIRIKLHINLFIALVFYDTVHLVYQLTIRHPDLLAAQLRFNSVECRVLNAMSKFSTLAMFSWMLMEGTFLFWLMMRTFQQPKLLIFIVVGWTVPVTFAMAYAIARSATINANTNCWMDGDNTDWIFNTALILCLLLNIVFLVFILRVITTKLRSQPSKDEPAYFGRAVKAAAILTPPFGLLLLFTLYGPNAETNYKAKLIVDCIAAAVLHLQGLIIAIILCYTNGEVLTNLRRTGSRYFKCCKDPSLRTQDSMITGNTHLSNTRTSISLGVEHSTTPTQETELLMKQHQANGESNNNGSLNVTNNAA